MISELIIWEALDYIELFVLAFLPLAYKLFFWLYTIQLKEYRWDRFNEYLSTKQWKSALFNVFFVIEFILVICAGFIWGIYLSGNPYYIVFWGVFYHIFFCYLVILNIFVIWKILRKRILRPKMTWRLAILWLLFIIWWSIDLYCFYKFNLFDYTYLYILLVFTLMPLLIFFYNLISLPLVNYKKNKLIKKAIFKSGKINNPIKIWITWSYWKSSVKEFLASILEQDWETLKTPENINTELWVSAIVLNNLTNKLKYFIAEMWAYKIWEIELLGKIVNHKYWFLTAIWNQHIGLFGNQENIKKGKSEIEKSILENNWILYINWDNENIRNTKFDNKLNTIKYWKSKDSDAKYNLILVSNWEIEFNFEYKKNKTKFKLNIIWEHNVLNLTWIIAFLYDIWLKTIEIKKYLKNIKTPKNTLEIIKIDNLTLINDTYNLSENGLFAWLDVLSSFDWEKILVMDDILELWKGAENIHFKIWRKIGKEKLSDKILFCGINYKESFELGLIEWWFKRKNILSNLDELKKDNIILFEWKKAKGYLEKINK